jgi:hypothetical protein
MSSEPQREKKMQKADQQRATAGGVAEAATKTHKDITGQLSCHGRR